MKRNVNCAQFSATECCLLAFKTLPLILTYFALSIGLTFYQRSVLQVLHFPLSIVICHLSIKFLLSWMCRYVWECRTSQPRIILSWNPYIRKACPTGIASGFDVAFSNWGLSMITVSLYTMTKSTVILFILGFALLFRLEKKSWSLIAIVMMISSGLFLFTYKATQFNMEGFVLILFASFASGLRWTLAQLVMQKSELGLSNPVDMVYHIQPWMIVAILPFAAAFEGHQVASSCHTFRYYNLDKLLYTIGSIVCGALLAFLMEIAEFLVVCNTSSLTLSVAGIFKEAVTLVLAVEWGGDQMSGVNIVGLLLCMSGIVCHTVARAMAAMNSSSISHEMSDEGGRLPLLPLSDGSDVRFLSRSDTSSESESDDDPNLVLFSVLQRRDNPVR